MNTKKQEPVLTAKEQFNAEMREQDERAQKAQGTPAQRAARKALVNRENGNVPAPVVAVEPVATAEEVPRG